MNGIQLETKLDTLLSDIKAIQDLENKFWSRSKQKPIAKHRRKVLLWKTAQRRQINAFYQFEGFFKMPDHTSTKSTSVN
jgi:hypothetical protein